MAGTLAAIAMLVVGLWVVHQPRESVGRLAGLSDEVALGVISAPQSGSVARPAGSYAEAMSRTWSRLVEVPFAGLDFSDVGWALGPPPPEAVQRADEKFCDDVGALALLAAPRSATAAKKQRKPAQRSPASATGARSRVIDLYLRSSPGSPAREALWDYFDGDERYKAKVAAQGGDGVLTRLSMLALFALGLLGAILLLAWLAIRLFTQAAIAFVAALGGALRPLLPAARRLRPARLQDLGADAARARSLAKVIYAAFLSVVLLGIAILGHLGGSGVGDRLPALLPPSPGRSSSSAPSWSAGSASARPTAMPATGSGRASPPSRSPGASSARRQAPSPVPLAEPRTGTAPGKARAERRPGPPQRTRCAAALAPSPIRAIAKRAAP